MIRHITCIGNEPFSNDSYIKLLSNENVFTEAGSSKLFKQKEGTDIVTFTPFALYILANHAKFDFSKFIIQLDGDKKYHVSSVNEVPDEEAIKDIKKEQEKRMFEYNNEIKELKEKHSEWFTTQESIENIAPYIKGFMDRMTYKPSNIEAIVDAYKASNAALKQIGMDDIPKVTKRVILPEYKEQWKDINSDLMKKMNVLTDAQIKQKVIDDGHMIKKESTRLTLNRKPATNTTQLDLYLQNFVDELFAEAIENI